MRLPRLKAPAHLGTAYYHCISRVVDRRFVLDDDEKAYFLKLMRFYEQFCKVRVLAYCLMSNHFHLLVEVPKRPDVLPSEAWLIEHVRRCYGDTTAFNLEVNLDQTRKQAGEEAAQKLLAGWFARLWDVSAFMKILKQRFTQWFNRNSKRCGTLWEDRFRSVLVESGAALGTMAAYIDLNPVRAGMVKDPAHYIWCSYGAAMGGDRAARQGLNAVVSIIEHGSSEQTGANPTQNRKPASALAWLEQYRVWLFGYAEEITDTRTGRTLRRGLQRGQIDKVQNSGGRLQRWELLRHRLRYLTRGGAIGSKAFVESVAPSKSSSPCVVQLRTPKTLPGGDSTWSGLRTLRLPRFNGS